MTSVHIPYLIPISRLVGEPDRIYAPAKNVTYVTSFRMSHLPRHNMT